MSLDDWLQQTMRRLVARSGLDLAGPITVEVAFADDDALAGKWPFPFRLEPNPTMAPARWYGPREPVTVGEYTLPEGMVYVGHALPGRTQRDDPALINPRLPIHRRRSRHPSRELDYWPDYARISPGDRHHYLTWLAGGRRDEPVPLGFLMLFYYGLERRILVDLAADRALMGELPALQAEIRALQRRFGPHHPHFRRQTANLLDAIVVMTATPAALLTEPPPPAPRGLDATWPVPSRLPLGLGAFAAAKQPLPAAWALTWGWYHPEVFPRTPALRCPDEFRQIFSEAYHATHGAGLRLRVSKRPLQIIYNAANPSLFAQPVTAPTLTDVFASKTAGRHLAALFGAVCDELDGYSRWLGRNPHRTGTLAALAALPPRLVAPNRPEARELVAWAEQALGDGFAATIEGAALISRWDAARPKPPKASVVALLDLLARLGYGVEPDVRFGGPTLQAGKPAVLFRPAAGVGGAPTPAYLTATLLLQLAAAIATADGKLTYQEIEHLTRYSDTTAFSPAARHRLHAHLMWLAAGESTLAGLKSRLTPLALADRQAMGETLVRIAAADGAIAPRKVAMLMRAYRALGLDPAAVSSQVHHAQTSKRPPPAAGPVTVRAAGAAAPGYPIPARPRPDAARPEATAALRLDQRIIAATMTETAAVAALLDGIFGEQPAPPSFAAAAPAAASQPASGDGPPGAGGVVTALVRRQAAPARLDAAGHGPHGTPPAGVTGAHPDETEACVAGLDAAHSRLLRALIAADAWSAADFATQAGRCGLLPAAALDVLNEAAFDAAAEPVIEGDDPLTINAEALTALLA